MHNRIDSPPESVDDLCIRLFPQKIRGCGPEIGMLAAHPVAEAEIAPCLRAKAVDLADHRIKASVLHIELEERIRRASVPINADDLAAFFDTPQCRRRVRFRQPQQLAGVGLIRHIQLGQEPLLHPNLVQRRLDGKVLARRKALP